MLSLMTAVFRGRVFLNLAGACAAAMVSGPLGGAPACSAGGGQTFARIAGESDRTYPQIPDKSRIARQRTRTTRNAGLGRRRALGYISSLVDSAALKK
jgi:hypothetical protein